MIRMRRWVTRWVWMLVSIGMAGCSLLGGGEQAAGVEHYTLEAPATDAGLAAQTRHFDHILELRSVGGPEWLNSKRMLYRLQYTADNTLAAYANSDWVSAPAQLVGNRLNDALSERGLFTAVISHGTPAQADLALQLELEDFTQYFSSDQASWGRIAAKATLLRADSGQVVAQRHFVTTVPAPSPDATGGVKALAKADSRLNGQLMRWLSQSIRACRPNCTTAGAE